MVSKKVNVDVKVDERQAVGAWDNYARSAGRAAGANDKFSKSSDTVKKGIDQSIVGLRGYVQTAIEAAKTIDALSQRAIAYGDAMDNLPFSIDRAARATNGMITQFDLAKNAIAANRLGAAQTGEEYAKLVKIASTLARTQGIDVKKGVEDYTLAIARSSPKILDNLGIIVKAGEANQAYANSIGKTVEELTEAEKREAFKVMALKKGEDAIRNAKVATDGWAVSIQQAKAALEDFGNTILNVDKNFQDLIRETDHLIDRTVDAKGETNAATNAWDLTKEAVANGAAAMVGYNRGLAKHIELQNQDNVALERGIRLQVIFTSNAQQQQFLEEKDAARRNKLSAADSVNQEIAAMNKRNEALSADIEARKAYAYERERLEAQQKVAIDRKRPSGGSGDSAEDARIAAAKQRFEETKALQLEEARLYEEMGGRVLEANDRRLAAELQYNQSLQLITTDRVELAKLQAEEELLLLQNSHDRKIHLRQVELEARAQFDIERQAAEDAAEQRRKEAADRAEQHRKEREKAREAAEKKALEREREIAKQRANIIRSISDIQSTAADAATLFGQAYIKNEEERAKFENRARGAQALGIATLEVVKAAAASASFNIPAAVAHSAAAAVGFAKGGLLLSGQLDPAGGAGGGVSGAPPSAGGGVGSAGQSRGPEPGEIPLSVQQAQSGTPRSASADNAATYNVTVFGDLSDDDIDRLHRQFNERRRQVDLEAM